MMSNVAAGGFCPVRLAPPAPGCSASATGPNFQAARPGQDLRDGRIHEVAELPRQRRLALRHPGHAARHGAAALRREHQADRRIRLRGSAVRRGRRRQGGEPPGLLLDERRLRDGHANDRRLRQDRVLHGHPRRRGRRQGRGSADAHVHSGRRRSRQPSARPRSASPTAASSSCPIWASCRSATTKTPTTPCSSAARRRRSPRSTTGRKPRPTRRSRHACHTSWRPADSPITSK